MRIDAIAWERAAEVREAAEGWLRAGAIDRSTYDAIRSAYPDPCVTPSPVWRALTAGMVTAVALCALAAVWIASGSPGDTGLSVLLFLFAGASFIGTERLVATPRLARRGVAGAASFWGSVFFAVGLGLLLDSTLRLRFDDALDTVLLASALVWAAGCWRWGNSVSAGFWAISLFLFLGRLPQGRVFWVLAGATLAALAARRLDDASWAPSHRRAAAIVLVAGIVAAYTAANVYSLDEQLVEQIQRLAPARSAGPPGGVFVLSALATAILPLAVLLWALRSRRMFLLDTGIVLLALSLVTLRHYVHVAPLWAMLTLSGAVLIALALGVERALRRAPGAERAGFTADPLFGDERRQHVLQTVPVVAAFTPAAPSPAAEETGFAGRGGRFGGGGASSEF